MLTFGERLRRARERKGLTQAEVSKITHISDKSLSRYETNSSAPDPDTIAELIRLYDVSADYILGLSYNMGHTAEVGTSHAMPSILSNQEDIHDIIELLPDEARERAEEYVEMLKTFYEVKSGDNIVDTRKRA